MAGGAAHGTARPGLRALIAAVSVTVVVMSPPFLTGALGLQVRASLGIAQTALGVAISGFFLATALSSALLGRIADRIGAVRSMQLSAVVAGAALLGIGAVAWSLPALAALLFIGGLANGMGGPTSSLLLVRHVGPRRQALAFGVKQAAIPGGTLLGGLAVPAVALTVGWRWAFVGAALLALAVAIAARRTSGGGPAPEARSGVPPLQRGPLVAAALALGSSTAAATGLGAFVVDLGVTRGLAEASAGLLLAAMGVAAVAARVGAGWLADRPQVAPAALAVALVGAGTLGFALLAAGRGAGPVVVGALLAFGGGWGWTGLLALGVARGNPAAPASATGVVQIGGASGGIVGPLLLGALTEHTSHTLAWSVATVLALIATVLVVRVARAGLLAPVTTADAAGAGA